MTTESTFTVIIPEDKQQQLDQLAKSMNCSRNSVINQAIDQYLDLQAWQVEAIQKGIDAANRGDLISHHQIMSRIEAKLKK